METNKKVENQSKPKRRNPLLWVLNFLLRAIGVFALSIAILLLLFRFEEVQSWSARQLVNYISNNSELDIEISRLKLDLRSQFTAEEIILKDHNSDTLLDVGTLSIKFGNLFSGLMERRVLNKEISIRGGYFKITRKKGEALDNFQRLLGENPYEIPADSIAELKKLPLYLTANEIRLESFCFLVEDGMKSRKESYCVDETIILLEEMNISGPQVLTREIYINQPQIDIWAGPYDTLFSDSMDRVAELVEAYYENVNKKGYLPFFFQSRHTDIIGGQFKLHNTRSPSNEDLDPHAIDWKNLDLSEINISVKDLAMDHWKFVGEIKQIGLESANGFAIDSLKSKQLLISGDTLSLDGLVLKTRKSRLETDLSFDYTQYLDYDEFATEVFLDSDFKKSKLHIDDLLVFVPALAKSEFFNSNRKENIQLSGRFLGTINNLQGINLRLNIGDSVIFKGDFDSRNLAVSNQKALNFNVSEFRSSIPILRTLIPGFSVPSKMDNIGEFNFKGSFNGYLKDFVAYGELETELGRAGMDMRMNITKGGRNAEYSGSLKLIDFDLGGYSENRDFGRISLTTEVIDGRSMQLKDIHAQVNGYVHSFEFKDYAYQNMELIGVFDTSAYTGYFKIEEENIDLYFDGRVLIDKLSPTFNVNGELKHLDLQALNISEKPISLAAKFQVDIEDPTIDRLKATGSIADFTLTYGDEVYATTNEIRIHSDILPDSSKFFNLNSSIVDASFSGKYILIDVPQVFINHFSENNSAFAEHFKMKPKPLDYETVMDYSIDIKNSQRLHEIILPKLKQIEDFQLKGYVDEPEEYYHLEASFPNIVYNDIEFDRLFAFMDTEGPYTNFVLSFNGAKAGKKIDINPTTMFIDFRSDTLDFNLNTANFESVIDVLNLEGKAYIEDHNWVLEFDESDVSLLNEAWDIQSDNYLKLGKKFIEAHNLALLNEDKKISILTNQDKSIELSLSGINLSELEHLNKDPKFKLAGELNTDIIFPKGFQSDVILGEVTIDSFVLNGDYYGDLNALSEKKDGDNFLDAYFSLGGQTKILEGDGRIILAKANSGESPKIDANLEMNDFPIKFLEYFISEGITGTEGTFDGSGTIEGDLNDPSINGTALLKKASTKVDLLGTRYYIDNQNISVTSDIIDLDGVQLRDKYGQSGLVTGGILHHNFKDLILSARVQSDRLLLLNTTKADNPLYYGHCVGSVDAKFTEKIDQPVIVVDAENSDSTRFFISVKDDFESSGLSYIDFVIDTVSYLEEQALKNRTRITGVDFTLNLTATPAAEIQIIFDELTRDIISGSGEGYLTINYNRLGTMSMYGDMTINKGEYTYTNIFAGNFGVKKPFKVQEGSTIQWNGDPFDAEINITASYEGIRAAPYNFIYDYVATQEGSQISEDAKQKTFVDLDLILTGKLLTPDINFDISFPYLTGELKNYTDRKLADLEFDNNEKNLQAASLLAFRDFVPQELKTSASGAGVALLANTMSEWLSSQISYYITEIFGQVINDVGFIENYEFDIGFVLPTGEYLQTGEWDPNKSEISFGNRLMFLDRRLEVDIGGNIIQESSFASSGTVTPYVSLEYILTKDRKWRIRAYSNSDFVPEGRRYEHGVGLTFRREFDSFEIFKSKLKKKANEPNGEDDEKSGKRKGK